MGRRGPPPKPRAIREIEGTVGRGASANRLEPIYDPCVPDKPKGLSPSARRIWDGLVLEMESTGVLRRVDAAALANLCEDQAHIDELRSGLRKALTSLRKEKGKAVLGNPLVHFGLTNGGRRIMSMIGEISNRLMVQRREFGLTPASNTRVEGNGGNGPGLVTDMDPIEQAICGTEADFHPDMVN